MWLVQNKKSKIRAASRQSGYVRISDQSGAGSAGRTVDNVLLSGEKIGEENKYGRFLSPPKLNADL